ncbi:MULTISPECIES: glutathione S-transferase C-terminal domain-containing protein [Streptomyces]|jgi:glutathionyl-hydroquinone reductase|uniref:Glutathione S-transferase family protein n=1 Tax=Streptomyces doudnae TaxID=3075536 RepID=A0ABD5EFK7_9ACTN|nr:MULTISPECIES: glutathione S-transferase C-terminal domain-containing protein [unclassified Streptomyces]MDT0433423.1 glutathione S-transferase family protein [Streptomyces sp. DSM 41981]MYQ66812.1 glutathione S-transferase family protein [Streptomyces sp. SID4950]SCE25676.1 putative glutathione S-transferase [Streptomyces sp. SolWspMP-5a-2]
MTVTPLTSHATVHTGAGTAPAFRGRIGRDARSGHYAVPGRYRLHLSTACPDGLRIAVVHSLLGLGTDCPVTFLPAVPDDPERGHAVLRPLYEASAHRYPGPALGPVLSDAWSGRIVSTHAPDITRDLSRLGGTGPAPYPHGADSEIEAVERMCRQGVDEAAQRAGAAQGEQDDRDDALDTLLETLGALDRWLDGRAYMLREHLTAADAEVWTTLVHLDTVHRQHLDATAVHRIADHPALWSYARRITAHPAFGTHLDLDGVERRHRARCRGLESAGAAVRILDWPAHTVRP